MPLIRVNGRRQHDKVSVSDRLLGIQHEVVYGAKLNRRLQVLHAPADAHDGSGQGLPLEHHAQRPTDEPDANNRCLFKIERHG